MAERLDQRSEAPVRRIEQSGAALDESAQRLGSSAGAFTREVSQALQQRSGDIIGRGLGSSVEQFNTQIAASARTASAAARTLETERQALSRERRTWLWLGSGALMIGSILAIGSAVYAVTDSRRQIERNRIEAELLRAYNQADVTLCGAQLCANVDGAGPRFGDTKEYQRVKPRQRR